MASRSFVKALMLFTLVVVIGSGCADRTAPMAAEDAKAEMPTPEVECPEPGIVLAEHGIRLGMTMPEDGRTLVGVLDLSSLSPAGIRFANFDASAAETDDCICICTPSGCTPADCVHCPKELCSDGTLPPCPTAAPLPDLRALLAGPRSP